MIKPILIEEDGKLKAVSYFINGKEVKAREYYKMENLHKMTKPQTFEDFLKDKHAEDYHGTDDDMPDAFDDWISNLDVSEVCDYAEEAIIKARFEGKKEIIDALNEPMKQLTKSLK